MKEVSTLSTLSTFSGSFLDTCYIHTHTSTPLCVCFLAYANDALEVDKVDEVDTQGVQLPVYLPQKV